MYETLIGKNRTMNARTGTSRRSFLQSFAMAGANFALADTAAENFAKPLWRAAVGLNGFQSGTRKHKKILLKKGGFRDWIMIDEWEVPDPYDACVKGMKTIRKGEMD